MKEQLIAEHKRIRKQYGSYLATQCFYNEKRRLQRIYSILLVRYKTAIF